MNFIEISFTSYLGKHCCPALRRKLYGSLTGVTFEVVEGHLSILADLDEVAVGITHVAPPFPAPII